jgi:hypothetical protein
MSAWDSASYSGVMYREAVSLKMIWNLDLSAFCHG